jgi:nucleotide-binding universal stress UspA family protein
MSSTDIERIAVGFDGSEEGRDAACLAAMISRSTGAEVTLVTVLPDPAVRIPSMDRIAMQESATAVLRELPDFMPPGARTLLESDWSVPQAMERVIRREEQDLLVIGASRRAPPGRVRIGQRTRQLLGDARCALAVAPRGLCADGQHRLSTIGVGYDGEPEARGALLVAGSLARAAGARLTVRAVVEDRLPYVGWAPKRSPLYAERAGVQRMWDEVLEPDVESLRKDAEGAAAATRAEVTIEAKAGSPPEELIALSGEVDLLVIGSRRWGAAARVLLGSTGEELMHDARCSVMVVPRLPASDRA